ncbi:MAG: hypothetical protein AAFZ01_12595, partial [Pseudomonadota bacterium]
MSNVAYTPEVMDHDEDRHEPVLDQGAPTPPPFNPAADGMPPAPPPPPPPAFAAVDEPAMAPPPPPAAEPQAVAAPEPAMPTMSPPQGDTFAGEVAAPATPDPATVMAASAAVPAMVSDEQDIDPQR